MEATLMRAVQSVRIAGLRVYVKDFGRIIRFYEALLGVRCQTHPGDGTAHGYFFLTPTFTVEFRPYGTSSRARNFAALTFDVIVVVNDIQAALQRLRARGFARVNQDMGPYPSEPYAITYISDPDGRRVTLFQPLT